MQTVWYFDTPTIGYCSECDQIATWIQHKGLHCPICKTTDLSLFEWNGDTKYPE